MTDPTDVPAGAALADLCDALTPGGRVGRVRRLRGGVSCGLYAVELRGPDGAPRWVALRRYSDERLADDPDACPREWRLLHVLARHGFPAARPLWLDAAGSVSGRPALATSLLPGRPQLAPRDLAGWTQALAQALARVHRAPVAESELDFLPDEERARLRAAGFVRPPARLTTA